VEDKNNLMDTLTRPEGLQATL